MPNHVYSFISVEEKYEKKLKEISSKGLCRHYSPMPKELINTSSPAWIVSQEEYDSYMSKEVNTDEFRRNPITKDIQSMYLEKYGADNWYDWSCTNWGTKWGCYHSEFDDGTYRFTTAWGPVDNSIINKLIEDIPSFEYTYEEEQGWGGRFVFTNGVLESSLEWDLPEWDDTTHDDVAFLSSDYRNDDGFFKKGYYLYHTLQMYVGDDFDKAVEEVESEIN